MPLAGFESAIPAGEPRGHCNRPCCRYVSDTMYYTEPHHVMHTVITWRDSGNGFVFSDNFCDWSPFSTSNQPARKNLSARSNEGVTRLHASAAKQSRCALFWDITQRRMAIPYRRFGTTSRFHIQGSSSPSWTS